LFVGFGLGVIVAALAVSPYLLVKILHKR
jgi:hypothetical protein